MAMLRRGGVRRTPLQDAIGIRQKQRLDFGQPLFRWSLASAGHHGVAQ
jgi:hypothetical protein